MRYANLSWQAEKARLACAAGDLRSMTEAANKMERCGYFKEAWKTFHAIATLQYAGSMRPWRGPHDRVTTLVLEKRQRDLGDELRLVHLVARAAEDVEQLIVQTEERLVPLFQRSYPAVRFISASEALPEVSDAAWTTYEQLAYFYARHEEMIESGFLPLKPPLASEQPRGGLGISWYSKAMYKCLPSLEDWARLLSDVKGRVQSLQYQEGRAGLAELVRQSGRPVKAARQVDQFTDLDGYAGQVSSVQRVLTISNTTAHMAGALGIPCVVVLDRESVTTWPDHGDRSAFYPNTRLIRRCSDDWGPTLQKGLELLMQIKAPRASVATGAAD